MRNLWPSSATLVECRGCTGYIYKPRKKIHILAYAPTDILQPHPPMTLQRLCLDTVHGYDVLATLTVIEGRR